MNGKELAKQWREKNTINTVGADCIDFEEKVVEEGFGPESWNTPHPPETCITPSYFDIRNCSRLRNYEGQPCRVTGRRVWAYNGGGYAIECIAPDGTEIWLNQPQVYKRKSRTK